MVGNETIIHMVQETPSKHLNLYYSAIIFRDLYLFAGVCRHVLSVDLEDLMWTESVHLEDLALQQQYQAGV